MVKKLDYSHIKEEFYRSFETLKEVTELKEDYELEYEVQKAKLMFSAVIDNLKTQAQKDAQISIMMHESGWDRKMAEVRTAAKIAYYHWSTLKSIIDSN